MGRTPWPRVTATWCARPSVGHPPTSPCNASTMKLQLRYDVHGSAERFWEVFFDPEVTRRLHFEALRSTSIEIEEQTGDVATGLDRTIRYGQKPDAPGPVKK